MYEQTETSQFRPIHVLGILTYINKVTISKFWVFFSSTRLSPIRQAEALGSSQFDDEGMRCGQSSISPSGRFQVSLRWLAASGGLSTFALLSSILSLRSPASPCYSRSYLLRGGLSIVSTLNGGGRAVN